MATTTSKAVKRKTTPKPVPAPEPENPPTTTYGSFNAYTGNIYTPTIEYEITEYLGEYVFDFNVRRIVADYVDAINRRMPEGVSLQGTEVVGPSPYDYRLNESIQNAFTAAREELRPIIARHDKSREPAIQPETTGLHDLIPTLGVTAETAKQYRPAGEYIRHAPNLMWAGGLHHTT